MSVLSTTAQPFNVTNVCLLPGSTGCGDQIIARYYYDGEACRFFTYSGACNNGNNFESLSNCESACLISKDSTHNDEHYNTVGFIMMSVVVVMFCVWYYVSMIKKGEGGMQEFEPHMYRQPMSSSDSSNKYKSREWLYVSNIAKQAQQQDILQLFQDFGVVLDLEFHETRGDKLNVCFVKYKLADVATRAMHELHNVLVEDHRLSVVRGSHYTTGGSKELYHVTKSVALDRNAVESIHNIDKELYHALPASNGRNTQVASDESDYSEPSNSIPAVIDKQIGT